MPSEIHAIRDFALQIEKTLNARRLYRRGSPSHVEAGKVLREHCVAAAADRGFTLRVGPADLFVDKTPLLNREKTEDAYFFPLYRDGLRELRFRSDVSLEEIEALLDLLETPRRSLGAADDMVTQLWRLDLKTIGFIASDGLGDVDFGVEMAHSDLRVQASKLAASLRSPLGAKVHRRTEPDARQAQRAEDASKLRSALESDDDFLAVPSEQIASVRAMLTTNRDDVLAERFVEILFALIQRESETIDPAVVASILKQLADGYWSDGESAKFVALLVHLRRFAESLENAHARTAVSGAVERLATLERLAGVVADVESGSAPPKILPRLFEIGDESEIFQQIAAAVMRVPEGELRATLTTLLRAKATQKGELLESALQSNDTAVVRGALAALDERHENAHASRIFALSNHSEETVRLRVLAIAGRVGGALALDAVWKAIEADESKSVRLFAFRTASTVRIPGLLERLTAFVSTPQYSARPVWEREKYARLLGTLGGPSVEPLFESWIPPKKWMWQTKDLEQLELAFRGLSATGDRGLAKVEAFAAGSGKHAEVARAVLNSLARVELGQTVMNRAIPTLPEEPAHDHSKTRRKDET